MPKTALLDGDIIAFRASAAVQHNYEWGSSSDEKESVKAALQLVQAWGRLARCERVRVMFTGKSNFRYRILPTYKGNRAGAVKPLAYRETVEAISERYRTDVINGLEADDLMGILATTDRYADSSVIVTIDKDLRTVPGWHLNPMKESRPVFVREPEADLKWMTQTLTGDSTDGYSGCPLIGPVKARAILTGGSLEALWAQVVATYGAKKLTEADALVQARVARILRRCDYDKDNKTIRLWHPKTPELLPLLDVPDAA